MAGIAKSCIGCYTSERSTFSWKKLKRTPGGAKNEFKKLSYQVASEEGKRTGDFGGEPDEVSHPVIELVVAETGGRVAEVLGHVGHDFPFQQRIPNAALKFQSSDPFEEMWPSKQINADEI